MKKGDLKNFSSLKAIDKNRLMISIVREETGAPFQMLSKAFVEYFTVAELKILEEWIVNPYY